MTDDRKRFTELISDIVKSELSETQHAMFKIEGVELINSLFQQEWSNNEKSINQSVKDRSFGFTQFDLETIKVGIDFVSLIIASFNLYLTYSPKKLDNELKTLDIEIKALELSAAKYKNLEIIKSLKDDLIEQNMSIELVERITNKYSNQIIKLANKI